MEINLINLVKSLLYFLSIELTKIQIILSIMYSCCFFVARSCTVNLFLNQKNNSF